MDFPITRNRPKNTKFLDDEFADQLKDFSHINFQSESDLEKEANAAAELARLQQEFGEIQPKTPNLYPIKQNEEEEIVTINTRASRRKRTIGSDRPSTAPAINPKVDSISQGFNFKASPVVNEASKTNAFEYHPLTPIIEEPNIFSSKNFKEENNTFKGKEVNNTFKGKEENNTFKLREENNTFKPREEILSPRSLKQKLLQTEMQNAQEERQKALAEQKNRFTSLLNQEQESLDKEYQSNLAQLKEWFEAKKNSMQNFLSQQEKINNLASILSKQSQTVSSLSSKFGKDKEYLEDIKYQELSAKERGLETRETRLLTQIQLLEQEKQRISIKQQNIEEMDERFRKIIDEEKYKVYEEQKNMSDLQESLKQQDREKKQILALEQHRLSLLEEQVEREEKAIEEEIYNKEKEIREKENLMEMEKNEAYSSIQYEKNLLQAQISQLENFKKSIPSINSDLNRRLLICEEKAKQLKIEAESLKKAQEMLEKDKALFEKEAQKIHQICIEIEKETESLVDQKSELDKKKEEIEAKKQEVLSIIGKSRQDKQRVEQLRSALNKRMRVYDSLKSPSKPVEIPKLDALELELEPIKIVSRPRSVISRCNFRASEYIKDLEQYHNAREDIQHYIAFEGTRLLNSKLDYETGVNKGFQASVRDYSTPMSSFYGKNSHSIRFNPENLSKPSDSQYIDSSFYKD